MPSLAALQDLLLGLSINRLDTILPTNQPDGMYDGGFVTCEASCAARCKHPNVTFGEVELREGPVDESYAIALYEALASGGEGSAPPKVAFGASLAGSPDVVARLLGWQCEDECTESCSKADAEARRKRGEPPALYRNRWEIKNFGVVESPLTALMLLLEIQVHTTEMRKGVCLRRL